MNGIFFDIQRFAVHDGNGIRSTLFSKGCILSCPWCQNPEGQSSKINLWYFKNKCIGCKTCINVCPQKALSKCKQKGFKIIIDKKLCNKCGSCVVECPALALAFDGREISIGEAVEELAKDEEFFKTSGGGVTISGGEPLLQPDFNIEILKKCKKRGFNTAVETCLYAPVKTVLKFLPVTDTFLIDMKIFDSQKHKEITGVNNELIKNNFITLAKKGANVIIRIPLIPIFTAYENNIAEIGSFISGFDDKIPVELINYNPLAANKYKIINKKYPIDKSAKPYDKKVLESYKNILKKSGLKKVQ